MPITLKEKIQNLNARLRIFDQAIGLFLTKHTDRMNSLSIIPPEINAFLQLSEKQKLQQKKYVNIRQYVYYADNKTKLPGLNQHKGNQFIFIAVAPQEGCSRKLALEMKKQASISEVPPSQYDKLEKQYAKQYLQDMASAVQRLFPTHPKIRVVVLGNNTLAYEDDWTPMGTADQPDAGEPEQDPLYDGNHSRLPPIVYADENEVSLPASYMRSYVIQTAVPSTHNSLSDLNHFELVAKNSATTVYLEPQGSDLIAREAVQKEKNFQPYGQTTLPTLEIYHIQASQQTIFLTTSDLDHLYEILKFPDDITLAEPIIIHCTQGLDRACKFVFAAEILRLYDRFFTTKDAQHVCNSLEQVWLKLKESRSPAALCTPADFEQATVLGLHLKAIEFQKMAEAQLRALSLIGGNTPQSKVMANIFDKLETAETLTAKLDYLKETLSTLPSKKIFTFFKNLSLKNHLFCLIEAISLRKILEKKLLLLINPENKNPYHRNNPP